MATDSPLTGTGLLVRLNLRLDRIRILTWTLAVGLGVYSSVVALDAAFPTPESLQARAAVLSNPATIMMTGPAFAVDDYTFGAMVANELALYVLLSAAIMSILLTVRHTRAEEESGRLELVRSLPVGRFAPAAAAVLAVAVAAVLVGAATSLALLGAGMEGASSLAFGVATALTGLVFAALAAVAAQLTEYSRAATGLAMAALALAFLVRGLGDVIDHTGSWLSWFSPFAWAQQTRVFVELRWWPLAVSLAVPLVLFGLAGLLARRRDLGAGLRPAGQGPASAARGLLTPAGLAQRLLRGSLIAWGIGAFFFAVTMGALADSLDDMLAENPTLADWVALSGTDLTAEFAGIILSYVLIAPIVLVVSGVLRLRAEEEAGRVEHALVGGHSRPGYLAGWIATVAAQTVAVTVIGGLGAGTGVWAATGEVRWLAELLLAALAALPAVLLIGAVAVALYGVRPRLAGLAWVLVSWVALVLVLGELLDLPGWARGLSPLWHLPALPAGDPAAAPLLVMGGLAGALVAGGLAAFRRRDIVSR